MWSYNQCVAVKKNKNKKISFPWERGKRNSLIHEYKFPLIKFENFADYDTIIMDGWGGGGEKRDRGKYNKGKAGDSRIDTYSAPPPSLSLSLSQY